MSWDLCDIEFMFFIMLPKRRHHLPDTKIVKQVYNGLNSVVWKHGSPKHMNWPNNSRLILHLIFKIKRKNTLKWRTIYWSHIWLSLSYSHDQTTLQFAYSGSSTREIWEIYTTPKTIICPVCNTIEDEIHFLVNCKWYDATRSHFLDKKWQKYTISMNLTTQINSFYWCQARTNKLQCGPGNSFINPSISAPGFIPTVAVFSPVFGISHISQGTLRYTVLPTFAWNVYWNTRAVVARAVPLLASPENVIQWRHSLAPCQLSVCRVCNS